MSEIEKMGAELTRSIKALSPDEEKVFDVIIDYLDTLPDGFFEDNSVDQLNEHFGGHDNMMITEKVRAALNAQQRVERMMDALGDVYDDLPEEDDEE